MVKRAVSMVLVVLALGCAKGAQTAKAREESGLSVYYPLAVGNRWEYQMNFLGEKRPQVVEITKQEKGFFHDTQGGQLMVDPYGIRDQKRYLLREPLEVGRTWTNVVSVSSVEHYRIAEVGAPCQAPAGQFEGCVKVEGRNRVDARTTLVNELTFAPSVGLVKVRVVAETDGKRIPQAELDLAKYDLKGAAER